MIEWLAKLLGGNAISRIAADKVYEIENLVLEQLKQRGLESLFPKEIFDLEGLRPIATPHITATYTLMSFNPEADSGIADRFPNPVEDHDPVKSTRQRFSDELAREYFSKHLLGPGTSLAREDEFDLLKLPKPGKNPYDQPFVQQIMEFHNISDPEIPFLIYKISRSILKNQGKEALAGVLSEIVAPTLWLPKQDQPRYLTELKDVVYSNHHSIINVAAAAESLAQQKNPSFARFNKIM